MTLISRVQENTFTYLFWHTLVVIIHPNLRAIWSSLVILFSRIKLRWGRTEHLYWLPGIMSLFLLCLGLVSLLSTQQTSMLSTRCTFISSPWRWWNTGTGCPGKLWLPPPWKCSRPGWMELWATWSSGRCPYSWQGFGTRWSLRSLPTLTVLWFCTVLSCDLLVGKVCLRACLHLAIYSVFCTIGLSCVLVLRPNHNWISEIVWLFALIKYSIDIHYYVRCWCVVQCRGYSSCWLVML